MEKVKWNNYLYRDRGRVGRLKNRPILSGGLWSRLQKSMTQEPKPVPGGFTTKLIEEVFNDLFYNRDKDRKEPVRPVRMQMWVNARTEKAANRKLKKQYKKLDIKILTNEEWEEQNTL